MKKLWLVIITVLLLPTITSAYYSLGKPQGFVSDTAQILNTDQRNSLESTLSNFEKETSNEIAVVTIPSLQGDTIENFAVKLFEDWGIGKKDKDNGILMLIARDDRQMRIEVGYGLEGAVTDAQSFWIINNVMKPSFQNGDYYGGISQALTDIMSAAKGEYNIPGQSSNVKINGNAIENIIFFIFILFIYLTSVLARSKSWWAGGVVGGIIGVIIGFLAGFVLTGIVSIIVLIPLGLLFDHYVSGAYERGKMAGHIPWWIGGRRGGGFGGGGFGGFGGGGSGGGGASGGW